MSKKLLSLVLALVIALAASFGGVSALAEVESVEVWYDGNESINDLMVQFFDAYEEISGVKITYTRMDLDSIHDKVIATASAGNAPDIVFGLPEWIAEFNAMGILPDLTPYYETWEDKDNIYSNVLEAMKVNGKYVAVPSSSTVRGLWVHSAMNEAAGIETPATWEELLAIDADAYYEATGAYPYAITCVTARAPQELLVCFGQYGLSLCDPSGNGYRNTWQDNEEDLAKAASVFQFYKDLLANGIVDPSSAIYGWEETDANFAAGLSGMFETGTWLSSYKENYPEAMADCEIAAIPAPADGVDCTYLEAKPFFVFDNGDEERLEAAFNAATYLVSKEWVETVFSDQSPRKDVVCPDPLIDSFNALKDSAISFPPVVLSNITQAMTDSIAKALQEDMDATEVAIWLSNAINASLKDSGEYGE